jgi:hypothetical protein
MAGKVPTPEAQLAQFYERLRSMFKTQAQGQPQAPTPVAPVGPPAAPPPTVQPPPPGGGPKSVVDTINEAGTLGVKVSMLYNGKLRLVEPYSFRYFGGKLRFYGYAEGDPDKKIRSFIVAKIAAIQLTSTPYTPKHYVEVARGKLPPGP